MHPKVRRRRHPALFAVFQQRVAKTFVAGAIKQVNIPGEFALGSQRQNSTIALTKRETAVPPMPRARIGNQSLSLLGMLITVRIHDRQPNHKHRKLRRVYFSENITLHHPGAVAALASGRRQQDHQPRLGGISEKALNELNDIAAEVGGRSLRCARVIVLRFLAAAQ